MMLWCEERGLKKNGIYSNLIPFIINNSLLVDSEKKINGSDFLSPLSKWRKIENLGLAEIINLWVIEYIFSFAKTESKKSHWIKPQKCDKYLKQIFLTKINFEKKKPGRLVTYQDILSVDIWEIRVGINAPYMKKLIFY